MYLVFYLQVCFVLVSSNPLYDSQCCPNKYPSYGNDQQFVVQRCNYNPYSLDLLGHKRSNPITYSQSFPHQYQHLNTNNFIPNYQFYNQNGLDILQHVPETETERVINNYILIPQEYFHNDVLENEKVKKTGARSKTKDIKNNKKHKSRRRRPDISSKLHKGNEDISNSETQKTRPKKCKEETEIVKSGRTKAKKNNNLLTTDVEDTLPLRKEKGHEELIKNTNNHLISSSGKKMERNKPNTNKPNYEEPKTIRATKKEVVNNNIPDVINKSEKKDDTGFADVNVSFDINEDCADLVCRHTRNKDVNKKNKPQSVKQTPALPNNLNNYMNSFPFNQQMNPNFFNPNGNFPFNFDYLYQMPQTSNVKPKETNNRRRNRKRKQPSLNKPTNLNKDNKNVITTVDTCDKVVELTPEIPKIKTTTTTPETTSYREELETKNVVQKEFTLENDQAKNVAQEELPVEKDEDSNLEHPIQTYTETLEEVIGSDDVTNNKNVLFENYNDVIDEYYPDFTLDNTYVSSKEEYDFGNFHDRYYYTFEDKPEVNRERRRYEHTNHNQLNSHRKLNRNNFNKNVIQESSKIQEVIYKTDTSKENVKFLTSPPLEFPGFKTEMINKEKYFAKKEHHSKNYDLNGISTNKIYPSSKQAEDEENKHNNNIEMVFANSKVVRYGAPEKEEVISQVHEPEVIKEFKNLISNDGKTTVVIAKSLGYSK